jgi:hypothetical protein
MRHRRHHWSLTFPAKAISAAAALVAGLLTPLLAPAASAQAATMATLYASPSGSGTVCAASAPCTLAGAQVGG